MEELNLPDTLPNPLKICVGEELDDGSFDIEWDENDPAAIALGCNDWTPTQWAAFLELCVNDDDLWEPLPADE